jgi:Icc protein
MFSDMRTIVALTLLSATAAAQDITGVVFSDRNGNGTREPREPGIANVAVSDQDTVVMTRADGSFSLRRGGGHGLVFVSLPTGYRVIGNFWRRADEPLAFALSPVPPAQSFQFVHASDTHISEQSVARTRRLRELVDAIRPAFTVITGDLVRDALRVPEAEARGYYDLFVREKNLFRAPVHTAPGNHEIFGIETDKSGVSPTHPLFGKAMYRSYLGPEYYSFNVGGVHFVALNTVDIAGNYYHGHIDSLQLAWLRRDLAALPPNTVVVTFNHIPFYSSAEILNGYDDGPPAPTLITIDGKTTFRHTVSNAAEVLEVLATRRHELALGGHIHIVERLEYEREGQRTRFVTSAATVAPVKSAGRTFPSGFTVYTVRNGVIDSGRFVRLDP